MKIIKHIDITTSVNVDQDVDIEIDEEDVIEFIEYPRTADYNLENIYESLVGEMKRRKMKIPKDVMPSDLPEPLTMYDELKMNHFSEVVGRYSLEEIQRKLPL